jgi:hypothetical protein
VDADIVFQERDTENANHVQAEDDDDEPADLLQHEADIREQVADH